MERPIIETMVASLPLTDIEKVPEDHEIWEEIDGKAFFSVTRYVITSDIDGSRYETIGLVVSGQPDERDRVIKEFTEVLGAQTRIDLGNREAGEPDTVTWVLREL